MITDTVPKRKERKEEYLRSDTLRTLNLPSDEKLRLYSKQIEQALAAENVRELQKSCNDLAAVVANAFDVAVPPVKVLGVRPHRVSDGVCVYEKFGDYDFNSTEIRLWMRTARLQKVTAFGTFLSTLCHELCHHIDVVGLELPNTFHTRGFYERAGILYHHAKNTPMRPLVWVAQKDGTYRIDWPQTMRGKPR